MSYRVHQFNLSMTRGQRQLEDYLNRLEGEVVAVLPNVMGFPAAHVDLVLIIERVDDARSRAKEEFWEEIVVP